MEVEISKETLSARVTQSQVKNLQFEGGDQTNTETLATSSLVEMSTFQVGDMPVSTSKKTFVSSALSGRVTRSKTRALPRQVAHSPPSYIDLGAEDTLPPTPPTGGGSDSDWEILEDHVV